MDSARINSSPQGAGKGAARGNGEGTFATPFAKLLQDWQLAPGLAKGGEEVPATAQNSPGTVTDPVSAAGSPLAQGVHRAPANGAAGQVSASQTGGSGEADAANGANGDKSVLRSALRRGAPTAPRLLRSAASLETPGAAGEKSQAAASRKHAPGEADRISPEERQDAEKSPAAMLIQAGPGFAPAPVAAAPEMADERQLQMGDGGTALAASSAASWEHGVPVTPSGRANAAQEAGGDRAGAKKAPNGSAMVDGAQEHASIPVMAVPSHSTWSSEPAEQTPPAKGEVRSASGANAPPEGTLSLSGRERLQSAAQTGYQFTAEAAAAASDAPAGAQPALDAPAALSAQTVSVAGSRPAMSARAGSEPAMRRARETNGPALNGIGTPSTPLHGSALVAPGLAGGEVLSRESIVARGGLEGSRNETGMAAESMGSGARDTFSALDGPQAGRGMPTWLHAGARQAEAGFEDPSLGWVGVRAGLSASGVHAAVLSGSPEAAQVLGSHMAGLSAHLAGQHIPVETVSMGAFADRGVDSGAMQPGTGQGQQQGADRHGGFGSAAGPAERIDPASVRDSPVITRHPDPVTLSAAGRGTHISVVA